MSRILCYHSVDPDWRSSLSIPVEEFERQVSFLVRSFRVLKLDGALQAMDRRGSLPRGTTALTFDDGYDGVYSHAFPLLARLGIRPALFLVSGAMDGTVRATDWVDAADRVGHDPRVIGADQLRELAEAGWSFGSHSHTHRDLTLLTEEECEHDLRVGREWLEDTLGRTIGWLAYPRGHHAEHVRRAAKRAGFTRGLALPERRELVGPMSIPRIGVYRGDGLVALRAKLSRWYLPMRTSPVYPVARRTVRAARRVTRRAP